MDLYLYARGRSQPIKTIYSHRFPGVVWESNTSAHANPSFSRDGMRIYYNKAVNENTSQAFCYDLTGLVPPMR